jgi:hypothetical protein
MLDKPETTASGSADQSAGKRTAKKRTRARSPQQPVRPRRSPESPNDQIDPFAELQRDDIYDLVQPGVQDWEQLSPEVIEHYYKQAETDFFRIVNDYLAQANVATQRYKQFSVAHSRWRIGMIIAGGLLAVINVCAALEFFHQIPGVAITGVDGILRPVPLAGMLSATAAVYAGALTVAATAENFLNRAEKAAGFRESRELLLGPVFS